MSLPLLVDRWRVTPLPRKCAVETKKADMAKKCPDEANKPRFYEPVEELGENCQCLKI